MQSFKGTDINIFSVDNRNFERDLAANNRFTSWPIVYILYDSRCVYIGETTTLLNRFLTHNQTEDKKRLINRLVVSSDYFNKSVTLQLEAYLIKLFSGDGRLRVLNLNWGMSNHRYFNQSNYEHVFPDVWSALLEKNIAANTVKEINNSDLFKYSPYKTLNADQQSAIVELLEGLKENRATVFIKGGAGTGKTILAIYVMKMLCTPLNNVSLTELDDSFSRVVYPLIIEIQKRFKDPASEIALVVPMTSLRGTLRKVFRSIENLSGKMVIGPTDLQHKKYALLIIDEAHRLKKRKNITNYKSHDNVNKALKFPSNSTEYDGDELDWILKQSKSRIFFYDGKQSIRPSDIADEKFGSILNQEATLQLELKSQVRSLGGDLYTSFVDDLLHGNLEPGQQFRSDHYEIAMVDTIAELKKKIEKLDSKLGLSRLAAGFAWEWKSKPRHKRHLYDIELEGISLRWNSTNKDWINSANAIQEVGCIHTTQGYDLNYIGIIFGEEIGYDPIKKEIIVRKEKYMDQNGRNGTDLEDLKSYIINIYQTLLLRGIKGTFIYCCDPYLKDYFKQHVQSSVNNRL